MTQSIALRCSTGGGGEGKPRLLDLYCCQGGAAAGYRRRARFDVLGVDLSPQPHYPFPMVQADALEFLASADLSAFAAIHASPPCQDHSATQIISGDHGTDWLLTATRELLLATGLPWVLENVQGAPLAHQADLFGANGLVLCGCMFPELRGLLYEDRIFETSFPVPQPPHVLHRWRQTKMGRPPKPDECMQITGHFTDAAEGRRRMAAEWMTRDGLAQAIPPAYTEYIGAHLLAALQRAEAAA